MKKVLVRIGRLFVAWRRLLLWLLTAFVACFALSALYVRSQFSGNATLPADCGIVFGAAARQKLDKNGEVVYTSPGPGILRRVGTAAELYREGMIKKLYLTGGLGEGMAESEASVMRRFAVVRGVALEDIVTEEASRSTWENLKNTLPMMEGCLTIVGISDRYHLARIRLWSMLAGRTIKIYPASEVATRAFEVRSVLREAIGVLLTPLVSLLT